MLVGTSLGGPHSGIGHQAQRDAFHLEQAGAAVARPGIDRRRQVRNLVRQSLGAFVDLTADLEEPEIIEVLRILADVLPDFRQQRRAQEALVGRDRIRYRDVIRRIEAESPRRLFAHERVVVHLGEALRHQRGAHTMVKLALLIAGRHDRQDRRRGGLDRVIADHPSDLFHQVILDRDVFGGAPRRHRH